MIFSATRVQGVFLIQPERLEDDRGFFARTYCTRELSAHGLELPIAQRSVSFNHRRGTLRGMHLQRAPHEETKIVSCSQGAIYDVALDLRPTSPTYRQWFAATLTATGFEALYIPPGCAHGFITLQDRTAVQYEISAFFHPASASGVRFDDPAFGIDWPLSPAVISTRDQRYPDYVGGASDAPSQT